MRCNRIILKDDGSGAFGLWDSSACLIIIPYSKGDNQNKHSLQESRTIEARRRLATRTNDMYKVYKCLYVTLHTIIRLLPLQKAHPFNPMKSLVVVQQHLQLVHRLPSLMHRQQPNLGQLGHQRSSQRFHQLGC